MKEGNLTATVSRIILRAGLLTEAVLVRLHTHTHKNGVTYVTVKNNAHLITHRPSIRSHLFHIS